MGMFFDYTPGHIQARFSHTSRGDKIVLRMRMANAITTTTPCDENLELGYPTEHRQSAVEQSVYFTSVFCPFPNFLRFLEAVSIQVQECAFEWDAEGPDGRLEWRCRFIDDTGFLTIHWDVVHRGVAGVSSHRMMINTRQMVRMLYSAFRRFVQSPEYDPIRYERMRVDEAFSLILTDESLDGLAEALVTSDMHRAESLLVQLSDVVTKQHLDGGRLAYPLKHYLNHLIPVDHDEKTFWVDGTWDSWDRTQRMTHVRDGIFSWYALGWYGSNLQKLRSTIIEEWLASPEPPRKSPSGIPRRTESRT